MSKPVKQPQDRKAPKSAADKLRAEAKAKARGAISRKITLTGRRGEATVSVLDDPMEWGIDASELLDEWQKRDPSTGGVTSIELKRFLMAIVSVEDADRIAAVEPTQASLSQAADKILESPSGDEEAADEASLGESQAS